MGTFRPQSLCNQTVRASNLVRNLYAYTLFVEAIKFPEPTNQRDATMAIDDFSLIFIWEKLYHAVRALAAPGELPQRLSSAVEHAGSFDIEDDVNYVPADVKGEFTKFIQQMQNTNVSALDEDGMIHSADTIINMFDIISRHHGPYKMS